MKIKSPNKFIYFLAYILVYPLLKLCFRIKVNRNELVIPDGPYIVLSNHSTLLDFVVIMFSLVPQLLNAVAARKFFLYSPLDKLLPFMGCIPKNMFDPDVRSIVGIKSVLKRGGKILLFPEGRCSINHAFSGLHISTGKLLKKLGVPVVSSYIDGLVSCIPLWLRGFRLGRMQITHKNLFSVEDLDKMTAEEINAAITARLSGAEGNLPSKKPLGARYSRKLADGLDRLLYLCPSCKSEFTTTCHQSKIYCTACGFEATVDKQTKLELSRQTDNFPHSIAEWFSQQVSHEMQGLCIDMKPIVEKVRVLLPSAKSGGGVIDSGYGTLSIDPKGWYFNGELNRKPANLFFPVDAIPAITFDYGKNIQLSHDGHYYIFVPEDLRKCAKYTIIAECLHRKFASKPLITAGTGWIDS